MTRRTFLLTSGAAATANPQEVAWTQWGGPRRNFTTESSGLTPNWPATGPKVIWKRPLGEGYSSPSVEGNSLYTMYGRPGEEIVTAISAGTGKTLWEQRTPTSFRSDYPEMGNGPYATPLLVGNRVFTSGVNGRLQCLEKSTGKVLWTQMLWNDHGGTNLMYGYASSPIAFRDTVIVPVGGRGKATMAFRQADGTVVWAKGSIPNAYSSPLLINVDGLEQLVETMDGLVFGLNPNNGDLQWQIPFKADYGISVATPVWCPGNLLFVSAEVRGRIEDDSPPERRNANQGGRGLGFQSTATPQPQRDVCQRSALFHERRKRQPGDLKRGGCSKRANSMAGAKHSESYVRIGGR